MPLLLAFTLGMIVLLAFLKKELEGQPPRRRMLWTTLVGAMFWGAWFTLLDVVFPL